MPSTHDVRPLLGLLNYEVSRERQTKRLGASFLEQTPSHSNSVCYGKIGLRGGIGLAGGVTSILHVHLLKPLATRQDWSPRGKLSCGEAGSQSAKTKASTATLLKLDRRHRSLCAFCDTIPKIKSHRRAAASAVSSRIWSFVCAIAMQTTAPARNASSV